MTMMERTVCACFVAILVSCVLRPGSAQERYDLVIQNGRVMDPESGLDAVRSVGIRDGKIVAVSDQRLHGNDAIEAAGLVVAPGFIDLHEHGQEPRNYEFQAHDGVTTSLELEIGTDDVSAWYANREGRSLINFGVSAGHVPVRMRVMNDPGGWLPTGDASHRAAAPAELSRIAAGVENGLRQGALAVGLGINYTGGASRAEIVEMFRVAARHHASTHVHVRYAGIQEPNTGLAGVAEVLSAAAATQAALHIVHITSVGLSLTPRLMTAVTGARARGLDVTAESYPYTAGSTALESAIFDSGWQARLGIGYGDLQWAATGERLTEETFARYRKEGGMVIVHSIPEAIVRDAMADPLVIIASDGMPITGPRVHPRGQGTFSRVLSRYVREEKALDLMTALRKMTLMPAQRLERRAPVFRNKGRIRAGADADITVFDPARVVDRATYEEPLRNSEGIPFVLVHGAIVIRNGQLVTGVYPGRAARAEVR
jgi:N-acyl-D-aspartate/D-glutamate deacylase